MENTIRPTAIGKKNWLFNGEAEAGLPSAMLFTIIEACRSRGIDAQTDLHDVLNRLPTLINRQIDGVTSEARGRALPTTTKRQAA